MYTNNFFTYLKVINRKIIFLFLVTLIINSCGEKASEKIHLNKPIPSDNQNAFYEFHKDGDFDYFKIDGVKKFSIPQDKNGNSLFYAAALAYLLMAREDEEELKKRFEMLFNNPDSGDKDDIIEIKEYKTILNIIKNLETNKTLIANINDPKLIELLYRFRKKLNFYIENKSKYFKYWFGSGNDENNGIGAVDFEDYKAKTKINDTYVGYIHRRAIVEMLDWPIFHFELEKKDKTGVIYTH